MARQATATDWERLAAKAVKEGIEVRRLSTGQWVAGSGSDAAKAYLVSLDRCECDGHGWTGRCKHRAALASTLGVLGTLAECRNPWGLTDAEMVALQGDAARRHALYGDPLVDVRTGEVIHPGGRAA
ncbi:MAG: hypothetical protein M3Q03_01735 [Chloroflexota bacterium]|nr:hypothetical protein [Chloroflexota bacterium]